MGGAFEDEKADILGGIFDTLAKAMNICPNAKLLYLPRMADFCTWGYAITKALGIEGEEFIKAYQGNIGKQNEEVIQGNTLVLAVLCFMEPKMKHHKDWDGTIGDTWEELEKIANPSRTKSFAKNPTFPKSSRTLRKHLEQLKTTPNGLGIDFVFGSRSTKGFNVRFQRYENFSTFNTVKNCKGKDCPLHTYRTGHNPALKGKRKGNKSLGLSRKITHGSAIS